MNKRPLLQMGVPIVVVNRILALIILSFPFTSMARATFFSVDNVSIAIPECTQVPKTELQYACHRFGVGTGFGVALRKYWAPRGVDDGAFEKLTIYFKKRPKTGQIYSLPSPEVFAYFSSGPSSFPGKHGCYGAARHGIVKVASISNHSVQLDININFDMKSPLGWLNECRNSNISMVMNAAEINTASLDAWYGKQDHSPSIWDESRP